MKVNIDKCYTEVRVSVGRVDVLQMEVKLRPYSKDLNARLSGSLFNENLWTWRCFELRISASQYRVGGHQFAKGD